MIACAPAVATAVISACVAGHAGGERGAEAALQLPERLLELRPRRVRRARVVVVADELAGSAAERRSTPGGSRERRRRTTGRDRGRRAPRGCRSAVRDQRLKQVRAGDDPHGRPFSDTVMAWLPRRTAARRPRAPGRRLHVGERRLHHVGDGVPHQLRVVDRALEQPALADRADDLLGAIDHRQLEIPCACRSAIGSRTFWSVVDGDERRISPPRLGARTSPTWRSAERSGSVGPSTRR